MSVQEILVREGVSVGFVRVGENPAMPNALEGFRHWAATVTGGERPVTFVVSIGRGDGGEAPPTPVEALALLAADLRNPALDAGPDGWLGWLRDNGVEIGDEGPEPWLRARAAVLDLRTSVRDLPPALRERLLNAQPAAPEPAGPAPGP